MKKVVIFVHGLGGSAKKSWGKFPELLKGDQDLDIEYGLFEYPTEIARIPLLQKKYSSIQDLAKALKTFITQRCDRFDEVILVGHSMGGLVIRKYLLDEQISGDKTKVKKVLFYAVPQLGSVLADISDFISWKHKHLKQLCKESDFLDVLNDQWVDLNMDAKLDIQCVIGLADKIVSSESSKSICRQHTIDMIPDKGHMNVIKPKDSNDLSYMIFRNFVNKELMVKYAGLDGALTYNQWVGYDDSQQYPFVPDEMRLNAIDGIRSLLINPKKSARIIGLSGLGKTRLALEVFRYQLETDKLQEKVIYIDIASGFGNISSIVSSWSIAGYRGIIVVDNCAHSVHMQLKHQIEHENSNLSLLTLDYNFDKDDDTRTVKLDRLSDDHIKQILEPEYGSSIPDLNRIISIAQGFPQIAVLLIKARLSRSSNLSSLTDDDLLRKMLWKGDEQNDIYLKILRACALFDKLGMKDQVEEEYYYISDNICNESRDTFYECIQNFKERGLIDERGRYIQLVPKPLAIRLAIDWWKNTRPEKQIELITQEMPGQLNTAFCDQMVHLDFLSEAVELVKEICQDTGPFGQAEVILSNLGSRLFRSLVEVNPEATMNALYRVILAMSEDEVLAIDGDVRRNIVWSLEKLSFRKSEFQNAARLLLRLAVSENESWSNNATGQFVQLFQTYLSGTEAPPELRLQIIDEAISSENNKQIAIIIQALEKAISFGNDMRSGGAENQGSGKPLEDWKPKIWQDVFDYWDAVLERLTVIALNNDELNANAKNAFAHHIRSLVTQGRIESIDTVLKAIVVKDGRFWPDAVENINHAIKYDSEKLPDEGKKKLYDWLELLKPDDIVERLKLIISVPPYTHDQDDEGNFIDQARIDAEFLSKEIVDNPSDLMDNLATLLTGEQRQARTLGRIIAENIDDISNYIQQGLSILKTIELPNPELIIAMMDIQKNKEKKIWDTFIARVIEDNDLVKFLPRFLQSSKPSVIELQLIIKQIKKDRLEINVLRHFGSGMSLRHLSVDDIQKLVSELLSLKEEGAWIALDILSMYAYASNEKFVHLIDIIKRVILQIEYETTNNLVMDFYYLEQAIKKINTAGIDEQFIIIVSENIFLQAFSKDMNNTRGSLKKIIHYLIKEHSDIVLPILFKSIEELTPIQEFRMEHMIGNNSDTNNKFALVNSIPDEKIIELCKHSEKSARTLAKSIKVLMEVEEEWKFTPVAIKLINEFGAQESVLSAISSNLHSFSWMGSAVPYYKRRENAFKDLLVHKNKTVQEWAKKELIYLERRIKDEEQRNEEHDIGIY